MTIYHPGKVIAIYSPKSKDVISGDKSVQVLVEMWDENLFTCGVDKIIAPRLKENDIVIVDYNPVSPKIPIPRHVITKIIRGELGKKTWAKYRERHNNKRNVETSPPKMPPQPPMQIYG